MGTLWHLQCTLILFCLSVLNTTGLRQRPTGGLRTWDPETAYLTRCDFNNNSRPFCDWTQPCNVNQGVWIRTKHDTPTDGTGPDGDYPDGKGYFIYQEASNLIPFDTNRLESPDVVVSGEICIDFWYYMFGSEELNELRVIIQDSTGESVAWSRKGNQSSSWNYGAVTHTFSTQRRIKVIFEAVRGLTEYGDTALDNVRVRDGSCDAVSTPVPPTPTPTEPTPSPLTEAICSIHGDPHYYTFDKQRHDFMGTCTYTLSKLCESNSSLPYFNVEAANEHRGSNTRVSYVQYVDVDVYGYRINLGKNRVVKVDGVIQVLPLTLVHPVSVSLSGQYVVVTTDFGLNVKFDGDHRAEITLPSTYMSKVCGICGNYNGNKTDDFLNPDGEMETNSASLGNSWQVYNDSRCLPDDGHTPNCTDDEKHIIQSNDYCGLVTDPSGPFQNCHSVVDPQSYFDACQYDLCEFHLNDAALCQNLQAYADVCQAAGVQLQPWRNATFCPLACPANSHYEPCAAACPATCVDPLAPYKCSLPCMEGCVCDSGYLLYNDRCVPSQQCGCWHNGQHYPVGSEFWTDNSCSTKCTCPTRGGKVQCSSASCPAGQYCGVQNGKPECLEHTYGICNVHGDPHYVTFDKVTHDFMGNCTYTLAKVCSNSSVPYFNVEAKNEHRGNPRVSYVREVLVEVYGERIAIVKQERSQVLVNGVRRTLPVSAAGGAIRVSTSGRYIVLETDFNLRVSYDADHSVEVRVPTTYSNLTCGMCGNFNSRREDDYMMPDGQQATDSNALGESWKVPDGDPSCGVPPPLEPCSAEEEKLYQSEQFCGILTASPGFFESCHAVINPQSYFDTCSYDLCALSGSQEVLCGALEAYADACQAAGVTLLPWRNATFCPVACPPNSHYNPCTSACPATCTDPLASKNCSKPCVEGCECNNGFVISGGQCVSMNNCGCLLNDKYYEKGEVFWQTDCAGQCVCTGSGTIVCDSNTCKASEVCKVQNGLLGCYPLNPSTCHIFGDPHYVTFDGRLYHFQGDCNYTVVETCTNSSEQFSVTTRNKHRGNPNWTALDSVAVTLKNLHIVVRRNKETYVDGFQVSLPVDLKHGATVAVKGHYVVIDTSLGIQVKFDGDQELFIQVDESLKGQLCGLCGTFNDNQLDDFLKPDNVLEQDPNKFGDSWLVKDDNWICNPVAVVPPTCDTEKEKEYEEVCKIILENSGPFAVCHWYIPPQLYFESCVYDLCATEGNSEQFCKILEAYAAACELGGVNLGEWREGTICAAPTACNISCTFDVDFCGWEQAVDDNFDWIRNKGPTPSPNTGPSYDHTTGDGYYIYLQGSEHNRADVARLASPICGSEGPHCFRFWYHMYGVAETMALRVYVTHNETSTLEWKEAGNKGDRWHLQELTVHSKGNMQIVLEGMIGEDFRSDVALDDLSIEKGYCPGDMPPTPSTSTPTPGTPTPSPGSGTCVVEGDPHYHTFDNQIHHFMGTCTYTLSKLCESNSSLPYFNVEAANEHRGGNTRVSYVQYVDVDVYGQRIRLGKGGVVTVNGVAEVLPCTPSAGVQVSSSGFYTVVTTDFGLRVKFDGNHLVEVTLPSTFGQKVCGMCGNYNGMAADDFLNPDGVLEPDSTSLGNSWQVSNDSSCSAGQPAPPACSEADKQVIASSRFCGLLTDSSSPFEVCHAVLSPSDYFNTCLYDLCELGLDDKALCNSLQAYADACQALGVKLPAWRNATFCPITCPANSHYEPCAAACPATCVDPMAPVTCSLPCVEGCVCDSGYLLYNDRCVPSQQCGCWHNGQHYPVGSEFWTDNSCSTKCTCPTRGGKVQCSSASCPAGQYCGVQNGKPECLEHTYGICNVHGDPHYVTFDKVTHDFMGNCTYTLAKVCSNSSVPYFNVEAKNEHRGNPRVSYVREVLVEVYGERIAIVKQERSQVLVNGVRRTLPVSAAGGAIRVSTSGRYIVLETDFNLRVSYDADHSVEVRVPTTYSNLTCGMCGNFNSRREDDYMMPDGQQATDSNAFGESWKVPDGDPSCGVPPPLEPCSAEEEKLYQSEQFCGILTASPGFFESCHAVINPQSYFDTCSYDLCALSGSQEVLCGALEAYADACQAAGVTLLPWRNATFCPLRCPANSYYDPCMTGCPATCVDQQAPQNCSKPCMEGCACTSGFLLSGDACVPEANCGCLFEGNYYSEGEHLVNENCTRQCQCEANGQMVCSELSCGEEEICKIQDGQPGCYPASTALCHIYGDPHYSTFDGKLHHFQGSCNYTVVTACDNSSLGFSITTRNEHRGSPSWTALNSVALSVEGLHIALRKNKAVYINGALASLPASPAPGVTISLSGSYVQVSTKLGLQVQFNGDHELLVRVSEKHQGKLCGLCGTYTGRQEDDFTRPDGVVVPDTNAFGDSWRVPDDEWPCGPTTETPPSCSPSAEEAANKECAILTQPGGPFQPCHAVLPPETYFESCVYDHCATNGSTEQLCNALGAYAAACAEAGVAVGDWSAGTVCGSTVPPTSTPLPGTTTQPPHTTSPATSTGMFNSSCNFNCTFDVDLCEWVQEASSSIDWTRHKGPTPSPDTGPSFDHTTGDGYYIYLHGSSYYEYLVSQLVSPVCNSTGPHCFRFWYHMYGVAEEMALRVYVSRDKELLQVWEATGNHGDRWHLGEVTVHSTGNMQIVLEGQWGEDFRSDVALDDLSIEKGYCPGDMPPTPSTSTPTPGTPTPSPGSGTCVVEGDPHYHTFDNQIHHFMGTCTYTLSKLCESNSSLPYFNVEAANEHRGGNTRVSYVQYVDVDVYGQRIRLGKGGVVTVNGVAEVLPCTPSAGVQVSSSGFYTVVTTDFGLRVKFDGNHLVEVTLPSTFGQKVCGMCGNYNGMAADDFLNPDGVLEPDSTSLGNSWQVSNDSSCSAGQPAPPACSEADKQVIASSRFCGLLTDSSSPFEVCHAVLSPSDYFNTCLYDLCELGLDDKALCNSLQAYADACQALGVKLPAWRNATFCPITCPANSHYEPCAAACPATCVDPMAPVTCSLPCVEGCVCDSGYLLYNDRCVPSQQCGCWHNGQHYPVGSEFWTDNSCSTKCTCPTRGGKVQCSSASCPAGQYCGVQNGKPECLDHTYGICHVHGDPHYVTFDKVTHDFMGNCTYTLAKVCSNSSVPYFNVEAKNEHRGNPRVSYVREVLVEVYGERIAIVKQERSQVLVNGVRRTLPVSAAGGAIRVSTSGRYIVLETDFNLRVSYDADHSVEVRVPTTYSNLTCGMCGNFNSRREDDYMMPDGQQATDSNALGESWKVPDSDPSCGVPSPPEPCSAEEEKLYQSEQFCGILTASPGFFESCHAVINPQSYFDTCSYDLCALSGSQEVLCGALEAYADACQAAGMTLLPWRNATFCPLRCPANSYYDPCMTGCPATCVDQQAPQNCSKPCMEGCACTSGFLLSGDACVPEANCGCLFEGNYYSEGEHLVNENCTRQCQCEANGQMVCSELSCGEEEICKIQDGQPGCYPASTALCHIYGDPHYSTFDGKLHHFQGSCNYTVVTACDNSSLGFSITTRNEHRGSPGWTALNSVALSVEGLHIALRKNKAVYINGALASLPASPAPGVTISLSGSYVQVSTKLGLQVQFNGDHELLVRVSEKHQGKLCGLCGTYTGRQEDDFTRPDGVVVPDTNAFGDSWRVPDDEWPCDTTPVTPPSCSPSAEEAANKECAILTQPGGPFQPCHAVLPPKTYFESCVYDHCATNGSTEQLCNALGAYAAACAEAGVALGDWSAGTVCGSTVPPTSTPLPGTTTQPPHTTSPATSTGPLPPTALTPLPDSTTQPTHTLPPTTPVPSSGTCVVEGDPHYHTFDNQIHHFMGTCTYTLSKLCESNSSLPYFNVEAANEHRGGNTRVSYVQYVDVDVYGQRIRLGKGGVVTVNGVAEVLPCTPSAGVQVSSSGFYTVVTTDFGLRVKFDGNHLVEVTLPSTFGQKVCGMCGNYNGMAADDFLNPDGVLEPDSTSLGNSWQVSNDSSCSAGQPAPPACSEADKQVIASSRFCGLLTDSSSPFEVCHAVLSPSDYFNTCLYDLCELGLDDKALCNSLQAYADACQALGVKLPAWRNATFCPITCPANSHYEPCAAACPATCVDPLAPYKCSLPCVEGCVCDSGYLLYNDRCVPSQQCGCWHNGQHYPVGSEFWTDNSCSTKCTCPTRGGKVQCSSASCPAGQYCGVQNGKPECLDHTYGICNVHNDPHYITFDKVTHSFMGNCTYTLAKVCSNSSVPYFNVEAKNEHRGNPRVSYVREVLVEVYGERIAIVKQERSQVLVNGVRRTLPVSAAGGAIRVSTSGRYIVLETDFNLRVSYDADHSVEVRVPTTYSNLTCGMCGNFNSRREDDYMMPDGQQAADSNALGESWKVPDGDPSCGVPPPLEPCSAEEEKLYQSEQFCGILTASPGFFESCHAVINPQSYFDTCSYDLCALSGSQEVLCGALEAYADACQAAGVTLLPWRNATFCPLRCPANSYYDPCMTGCPATCVDQQAPQNCSKPCMEGCACTSGFLLSGDACVPEANCGCLFEGNYYSEGEHLVNENCTRQCQCEANGQMVCSELSCGEEEICKIQDGQPGCYPASTALCHIYGDPHYSTFDGKLHHFQGSCNYTVVTACDNSSLGFSITTRNEHRGSPGWTALNSVALSVEGLHIALRKNKAVYINGALASLPASPAPGVTISLSGSYVQVSTKLGLQVQFNGDHELLVRVSEKHQGKLCGLCGTYTGRQEDDFTRPDGVVVPDTNAFGDSWRVPDDEWPCDSTPETPPSCSPSAEEAANKECAILTQPGGPFQPCHAVLPPETYFESCVYDHCATNGSTEQLCNTLGAYAAACAEAGVAVGDWSAGTVCALPTACNFNCTFDVDLCEWVQEASSSIDWTRHKGPTPSPDTGPSFDHTTGDGYYIYLHGSSYYEYLVSQLVSPVCNSTGPHCFRFWYHMYGVAEEMALRVYVSRDKELLQVWEATGNHGDRWHLGEVTVHSTGNMQIVLEGQWGEDFRSDVALDDLSIEKGYCPGDMPPTPSTSTPTPGTPTPSPGSGTCVVEGDPHYHTFDNQIHHFMGTCTYTLSKLCESNSSLPYFNVEAANEHRGGNTRVSYVQYVDVDVYGQRIRLGKGGVVTVNGVAEVLPCTPSAGVQVSSSGFYTVVTTDFGLRVKFDGNHLVEVTLPSTFGQKVCGMCGNYNGMAADDFLNPDGVLEPDSTSLGNSWQVSNDSSCSAGQPAPPACSEADKQVIASSRFCGLLTDSSSPFEVCHAVLSPSDYFNTCLYDLCELGLDDKALCNSLQAYADACQALGVKLPAWRNATFCPITCPANSHYEPCAAACPATCVDPMAPVTCSLPCVEGCVCDSGYLLYNDRCVPSQQCGCWHNGQHYPVGSEFWTDNSCSTKCTCPTRGGKVQCSSASCPAGQYCGVQNGKPECLDHTYGICHVHGDPHYVTFDKVTHDFMGNCTYTLAKVCSNSSVPYFNVEAKNEHRGNPRVSYVREVLVEVYGERIAIVKQERSQVLVNGVRRTLPVSAAGGAIRVSTSGRYIVLETDFNLRVSYDADHSVEVRVPTTYSNLTCGMCGNFNSRREDDYMMPDGQQATDSNALGESWKVPDSDPSCGVPSPPEPCSAEEEKLYQSEQFCGILTASPGFFESCHAVINPQSYFDTCSYDLCALSGSQEVLCGALEAYADACQAAGVTLLPWRNATFCPLRCPANSYYDPCMTGCPATCVDQQAPQNCSKPCMEGCACTSGFLLSGDACVPEANCGCLFEGNYYSEGEHLVNENCTRQCQCEANGQMVCSELSCGEEEICKIQDGQPGCYPASTALCHIYGDPHYSTFDGKLHHFQGSCNYTVVTACDNSSLGFSITTRNEHRGSPGWTALNSVALSVEGLHIALRKNKAVYINGALASLPASPAPGVTISLSGSYVQVSTKLGLQVQFNGDHELLVRVSEKHQGKLCGLCGTYTGRQEDDFTRPDGVVVPDTNAFGDSWRVPDDEWPCDTTPVTPPSCSPSAEEAANKECAILTQPGGPFQPCHAVLPPKTYFESCVYDHCATNGSTEQLCNALGAYAAACAEAGVALGDWSAGTVCGSTVPPTSTPLPGTTTQPPHTTSPATSTDPTALPNVTTQPPWTTKPGVSTVAPSTSQPGTSLPVTTTQPAHTPSPPRPTPSSGHASCSASGDPHYNTFDHRVLHFMGNCTYTLSKVCNISQRIPYFDVSTTNEHRGANTKVSYVKSVQVEVYGNQISMLKNKKVNVNGRRMNLPIFIERKISIQSSGGYVLLETDFGLWVRYDGNHYAEVSVPSDYSGLLCGLCGNYNGDPTDDNIKPNGDIASNSNELGESWLVPENNTICSSGIEEECNADLENDAKKNTACGMITDPTGLFKDCHTKVPPENFFESCVYDMCFTGGQETSLCYGLQAYAESCNNAGICIEWRNTTLCPMSCPGGSIYQSCGTRCPSTCVSNSTATSCSLLPVEGCFCKEGYILSGDTCVPESSCGCVDEENQYHQLGESWFTSYSCNERCTCNAKNKIVCSPWECGVREECSVKDGVLGCHSNGQATCQVAGDPHYFTFDGLMYTFVGTCTYTLVEVISESVENITILGKNEDRGLRGATYLKEVYIDLYGVRITLQKSKGILLNNERVYTPVENRLRGVSIGNVGKYIVVETDFGVVVKYDGDHYLEITLPQSYFSKVHGMCGNFNDNLEDDLSLPNGTIVSITQFGNSWKVEKDSDAGCLPDSREDDVPPCTAENKPVIESQCNVLNSDKFKECHSLVKPEDFIKICIHDMCQYNGMKSTLCDIVQFYVDTCRNQGITIIWRNNTFCPLPCPTHSHYTNCASSCPSTCNDIFASSLCEKTEECTEGCECDNNYVLSNGNCVPLSNCGCRDDDNNYYSAGETWITAHCAKRCKCQQNGVIQCTSYSCDSEETCVIKSGKYKCNPTGFGTCRIMGDPHYVTFDGLVHHFQGKYTYIVAQTIPDLHYTLTPFSIEGMNYPLRRNSRITYLKEILINVYNHKVRFREGKQILLDGVRVRPPLRPHEGIRIYQRTKRIYLETDFGLYVSFDGNQNADIRLANTYKDKVEGLCGDFDGRSRNDFASPNGVLQKNVNIFGESWKVPLNRKTSRLRRDVSPTDESEVAQDTGLFQGCSENQLTQENSTSECQILTQSNGPFAKCHSEVSPDFYYMSCIFDMCVDRDDTTTLCRSLEEYVLACQEKGVNMEGWRQETACEMPCPANSKYSSCMSACPASCSDLTSPSECEWPCVEGCECLPGYVLSGFECVPYSQCGCSYLNKYYEIGEIFITDDCSQRCQCTESSTVSCTTIGCGSDEICNVSNYTRGCYKSGPCMPTPCQNDGVCSEITNGTSRSFYCECSELYTGQTCEVERREQTSPSGTPENHTVAIAVGVSAGVIVVLILISSAVYLHRRKRKMSIGAKRRDSSFNRSRDTTDNNVYEQDYGCIVNTAFDQDESAHDTNL
ncbi:IgGFc-binding protein-like isoform X6 [Anas acuta]|uniref:IgGFc-binding protein-like isoform X6 n=1 Tax=Anas acuta TaxID=28680 RepID=UPI0035C8D8C7